ncbi:MAG TPA: hypothetical protein VFB27_14820 [Opitutaceae bacterium]|nr:hypothetical protein [Opitutaceae bacterium]
MPIAPDLRKFYGHHWRTVTRPRIYARQHGLCNRCSRPLPKRWECAHLKYQPPHPRHDADDNLAGLCHLCHKRVDYEEWARKCWLTRTARKDAARGLLQEHSQEATP